jgi:hypothetical protein
MAALSSWSKLSPKEVAEDFRTHSGEMLMRKFFGSVAIVTSLLFVAAARSDEEKVNLDKVPAPALEAVKKRFPGAEIKGASKEVEDGKTLYEITLKDKGLQVEVTATPEGKLVTIEREIAMKNIPEAVRKTFDVTKPNAKVELIEEVIKVEGEKETLQYYEFHLPGDVEVCVLPDGKLKTPTPEKK